MNIDDFLTKLNRSPQPQTSQPPSEQPASNAAAITPPSNRIVEFAVVRMNKPDPVFCYECGVSHEQPTEGDIIQRGIPTIQECIERAKYELGDIRCMSIVNGQPYAMLPIGRLM